MQKILYKRILDNAQPQSFSNKMRRRRFILFKSLLDTLPRPLNILDAGGTKVFWTMMEMTEISDVQITLLNLTQIPIISQIFKSVAGDVRDMSQLRDQEFDVVFSNSVIEHVGGFSDQLKMADEVRRVGKRYFVQTPNRYFPLEPHFLFPFFQFLPISVKVWLLTHFSLGNYPVIADKNKAINALNGVRLLSKKELKVLFPNAVLFEEKFLGLTKSFILYEGW